MFVPGLKFIALNSGGLATLQCAVAAGLEICKTAFQQLQFILDILAFLLPSVATCPKKRHQFPQRTPEFNLTYGVLISLVL